MQVKSLYTKRARFLVEHGDKICLLKMTCRTPVHMHFGDVWKTRVECGAQAPHSNLVIQTSPNNVTKMHMNWSAASFWADKFCQMFNKEMSPLVYLISLIQVQSSEILLTLNKPNTPEEGRGLCHHCFIKWLGAIWRQAILWNNADF